MFNRPLMKTNDPKTRPLSLYKRRIEELQKEKKEIYEKSRMPLSILNAVGAGLSLIDREMRIVWVNKIHSKWFGRLDDLRGKFCYKVYQKRNYICPNCPTQHSFLTGKAQICEQKGITSKGDLKDYLLTTVPIYNGGKKPKYVLELAQDITQQKNLERKLIESENVLKNIFEHIDAGIFVIIPNYTFSYLNPKAHRFFNIPYKLPIKCCDIFSPNKKWMGCERCQLRECFDNKKTLYYEFSFAGRTYSSMLTPIIDHLGNVIQLIEISIDITEFKDLQTKVKDSEELATIGKIAAGIAHEIRNPIFGISSIVQLWAKKDFSENEQKSLTKAMLFETERLNNLLEDLLILSSPKRLKLEMKNPHTIINEVLALNRLKFVEKSLAVTKRYHKSSRKYKMDARQMKLLFQNLIDNAVEASRKDGEIHIWTNFGFTDGRSEFYFKIKNSGEYIRREEVDKIFEPFYSTKPQGTGLGLSICKRIIKDFNGTINVKSKPKRTEFTVSIPIL